MSDSAAASGSASGAGSNPDPAVAPKKPSPGGSEAAAEQPLPPLTPEHFRVYNRLAEQMDYFHNHFREMWTTLYTACTNGRRPPGTSLRQFIDEGLRLTQYLEAHHSIEESYLYPLLARKMPQFKTTGRHKNDCELLKQHQQIHEGMDVFVAYLQACKNRETELELSVLKEKMDLWGEVLMKHLDQEVKELEADVMRRYWTMDEVKAFPI
ncbi:hypothetical protein B0H66DRAFT_606993 [Apodospora peruviana]|uniref:Hemerythrin-like domain-containing protein n=1 Tax=Apodospora peruviana TaxID=516989 RepID=A0AAE0HVM8_9PEZI|nr:hypothetical protein B0H66DRAFT_606993 [Apodospora peruviana]